MGKTDLLAFDYKRVARLDTDMWRAYYNHQFFKLFWQLLQLTKTQLGLSWYQTIRMSYYSAWAAADYRLRKGNENYPRTLKNLTQFYEIISKHNERPFDFKRAAELELEWWDIHRYPDKYKKTLELSLAEGMAVIYGVDADKLTDYAHYRAVAMLLPHHEGDKQVNPPDWNEIYEIVEKSWQSLHDAVQDVKPLAV